MGVATQCLPAETALTVCGHVASAMLCFIVCRTMCCYMPGAHTVNMCVYQYSRCTSDALVRHHVGVVSVCVQKKHYTYRAMRLWHDFPVSSCGVSGIPLAHEVFKVVPGVFCAKLMVFGNVCVRV